MRLIDRLLTRTTLTPWPAGKEPRPGYAQIIMDYIAPRLPGSKVIVADNVARFFYAESDQEVWKLAEHFPNLAPPFREMFIQTLAPPFILSEEFGKLEWELDASEWGIWIRASDPEFVNTKFEGEPKWILECVMFAVIGGQLRGPCTQTLLPIDSSGRVILQANSGVRTQCVLETGIDEIDRKGAESLLSMIHPLLLSICFMHCKNVEKREVVPSLTRQQRRHNPSVRPASRYYTLEIDPMKKVLRSEGGLHEKGLARAIHICRGHFATYDEKPLFGKYKGTFWKPDHVRGRDKEHRVEKIYNVLPAPEEES